MIRRIWRNIKWAIFNHPPTSITRIDKTIICDYCNTDKHPTWTVAGYFTVCYKCLKECLDKYGKKK